MSCDLNALFQKDRAKSPREPWSEADLKAIYEDGIPPKYVRMGILDREQFKAASEEAKEAEAEGRKPLLEMSYAELAYMAGLHGGLFRNGMEHGSLIQVVRNAIVEIKEAVSPEEPEPEAVELVEAVNVESFDCPDCDFSSQSAAGLKTHSRKHK